MKDQEAVEMMKRASEEIKSQRRTIDRLTPRAEAFYALQGVLSLMDTNRGQGMGEDVAWMLDKRIQEIESADTES